MIKLHSLSLSLLAGAFLLPALSQGQSVKPAVRIVEPIDEAQLVTLKGNTNPHANAKNDLGAVSPSLSMPDLNLVLSRSAEQARPTTTSGSRRNRSASNSAPRRPILPPSLPGSPATVSPSGASRRIA
jgi:hypothetical protein